MQEFGSLMNNSNIGNNLKTLDYHLSKLYELTYDIGKNHVVHDQLDTAIAPIFGHFDSKQHTETWNYTDNATYTKDKPWDCVHKSYFCFVSYKTFIVGGLFPVRISDVM